MLEKHFMDKLKLIKPTTVLEEAALEYKKNTLILENTNYMVVLCLIK